MNGMKLFGITLLAASSLFARGYKGMGYTLPSVIRVKAESGMSKKVQKALEFWSAQTGVRFELVNRGPWDIRLESALGQQLNVGQEGVAYMPGRKWNGVAEVRRDASAWVMAHEIGHLLGYGHVDNDSGLMNPVEKDGWGLQKSEGLAAAYRRGAASK